MFNNRMLAVAAVLVMAVPALGAATPIVVPPVPEQLVEGHTVFTVIEIARVTNTAEVRFAAAVAVLVREYQASNVAQRFPGVLWFNDQYLVNPSQDASNFEAFRYPCGGSVIAVNAGDPDPRVAIARLEAGNPGVSVDGSNVIPASDAGIGADVGDTNYTYDPYWVEPTPGTYYYGQDSGGPGDDPTDYAWVGAKPGDSNVDVNTTDPGVTASGNGVYSDTVVGTLAGDVDKALFNATSPWDYDESYLITDPNDHSWVVDKYKFYTRDSLAGSQNADNLVTKLSEDPNAPPPSTEHYPIANGGQRETLYDSPVWVVNILGSPVFVPVNGVAIQFSGEFVGENCMPFRDLLEETTAPVNGVGCGFAAGSGAVMPFTDDPCMGYMEPSRNGYCYGGQEAVDVNGDLVVDQDDCLAERAAGNQWSPKPLRLYNALLYFKLEDLRIEGADKDHSDPINNVDTNGCSQEVTWWSPAPSASDPYTCPNGDDDLEGNSHSFHPSTPPHTEAEPCLPEFAGPNPTNHGGSTYITPADRTTDGGWYEIGAPCDYMHATRNIDIYFSGGGRPFPPVIRTFDVMDLDGSSAPFQDYHAAYP
jgi:hypothetical protein